jgi:hypothetical protein
MDGCDMASIIQDPLRLGNSFVLSEQRLLESEAPASILDSRNKFTFLLFRKQIFFLSGQLRVSGCACDASLGQIVKKETTFIH